MVCSFVCLLFYFCWAFFGGVGGYGRNFTCMKAYTRVGNSRSLDSIGSKMYRQYHSKVGSQNLLANAGQDIFKLKV